MVFPHEPLLRVRGPILQAQLLETALLNIVNFQTLIATKAARVCLAARGDPVLEFGLRRAQGLDGGLAASRAAYVGGAARRRTCSPAGCFGIPVRGTHAHSWVMSFDDELEAFEAYARAMPNNCVFLVDTYDTLEGVRNAVKSARELRASGHEAIGIRLDSGDLAWLSIEARRMLDAAGFQAAMIVASNDLDEHLIESLKEQGATIDVWGVGTRLVTGYDQPALGGVYKLGAVREPGGAWQYASSSPSRRSRSRTPASSRCAASAGPTGFVADVIYDEESGIARRARGRRPDGPDPPEAHPSRNAVRGLLVPVYAGAGRLRPARARRGRARARAQLAGLHPGIRRFVNPHQYPVGLELRAARAEDPAGPGGEGASLKRGGCCATPPSTPRVLP